LTPRKSALGFKGEPDAPRIREFRRKERDERHKVL
jgi:hypothetical protein